MYVVCAIEACCFCKILCFSRGMYMVRSTCAYMYQLSTIREHLNTMQCFTTFSRLCKKSFALAQCILQLVQCCIHLLCSWYINSIRYTCCYIPLLTTPSPLSSPLSSPPGGAAGGPERGGPPELCQAQVHHQDAGLL